jgi:hypothetical protein
LGPAVLVEQVVMVVQQAIHRLHQAHKRLLLQRATVVKEGNMQFVAARAVVVAGAQLILEEAAVELALFFTVAAQVDRLF